MIMMMKKKLKFYLILSLRVGLLLHNVLWFIPQPQQELKINCLIMTMTMMTTQAFMIKFSDTTLSGSNP